MFSGVLTLCLSDLDGAILVAHECSGKNMSMVLKRGHWESRSAELCCQQQVSMRKGMARGNTSTGQGP